LVITTPLARTIQTTQIALEGLAARFLLTPELCESAEPRLGGPQRGHSLEQTLQAYPFVREWDTSYVREWSSERGPANWVRGEKIQLESSGSGFHHPLPAEERLASAIAWLVGLDADRVAVVGHSGVLDRITGTPLSNCQRLRYEFKAPAK